MLQSVVRILRSDGLSAVKKELALTIVLLVARAKSVQGALVDYAVVSPYTIYSEYRGRNVVETHQRPEWYDSDTPEKWYRNRYPWLKLPH